MEEDKKVVGAVAPKEDDRKSAADDQSISGGGQTSGGAGGAGGTEVQKKKRKRSSNTNTQLCYGFKASGTCRFGDECRFAHGSEQMVASRRETMEAQRKLIRSQSEARQGGLPSRGDSTELAGGGDNAEAGEETVPFTARHGNVVERYYTQLYASDLNGVGEDQYVNMHSNRLCVVGLAPQHPLVRDQLRVASVNFSVSGGKDLLKDNVVRGKKKKGGIWLDPKTPIARVTTVDGQEFILRSGMRGMLLEVNAALVDRPQLLADKPTLEGHLAILRPKPHEITEIQEGLMTKLQYNRLRTAAPAPSGDDAATAASESSTREAAAVGGTGVDEKVVAEERAEATQGGDNKSD